MPFRFPIVFLTKRVYFHYKPWQTIVLSNVPKQHWDQWHLTDAAYRWFSLANDCRNSSTYSPCQHQHLDHRASWFSSMPATNYVVTVQRPTAVSAIATGNFTSSTDHNLIVAKNTYLNIYLIDSEGLKLVKDVPIYGRINILRCFRLPVIRDRWSIGLFFFFFSLDRIRTKIWYSF